jgi:hypothetical protein
MGERGACTARICEYQSGEDCPVNQEDVHPISLPATKTFQDLELGQEYAQNELLRNTTRCAFGQTKVLSACPEGVNR